jgi:hypothetical protein
MKKWLKVVLILLLAVVMGFLQEYVKVNINYHLEQGDRIPSFYERTPEEREQILERQRLSSPLDYYYSHAPLATLSHLSRRNLVLLKWVITVLFTAVFLVLNTSLLFLFTSSRDAVRIMVIAYATLFGLAFLIFLLGMPTQYPLKWYGVSRKLIGGLQSLFPVMLFLPSWHLNRKLRNRIV